MNSMKQEEEEGVTVENEWKRDGHKWNRDRDKMKEEGKKGRISARGKGEEEGTATRNEARGSVKTER